MKTLAEVQAEVEQLAKLIDAPAMYLPTYDWPKDDATPFIEVDARGYHYVVSERGAEYSRLTTDNLERVLYSIFRGVTFSMACEYEVQHRVNEEDSRRVIFPKQIELLSLLSSDWAERMRIEKDKVLSLFPFDDASLARARLCKELRELGESAEGAWRIASERYPEPKRATPEEVPNLRRELEEGW